MHSISLVARELTMDGVAVCGVEPGARLALLGYHLYAEDEQKNPHHMVIRDGDRGRILVCIPTTVYPAPVGVFFPAPIYLSLEKSLVLAIVDPPKILPAKAWGTLWVQ